MWNDALFPEVLESFFLGARCTQSCERAQDFAEQLCLCQSVARFEKRRPTTGSSDENLFGTAGSFLDIHADLLTHSLQDDGS